MLPNELSRKDSQRPTRGKKKNLSKDRQRKIVSLFGGAAEKIKGIDEGGG